MTVSLYERDAYRKEAHATVVAVNDRGGVILDQSLFYPTGGGQPGDSGELLIGGETIRIATTVKGDGNGIVLVPEAHVDLSVGTPVLQRIDWSKRFAHMRVHSALHLLSVVIPLPVTGGQISAQKGRLDFDMPTAPDDKQAIEDSLNELVERDLEITDEWISDEELAANPGLVKTMSVKPPSGRGKVRLVRVSKGDELVDLQPCGGTHVRRTGEIGRLRLGKVEKKSRLNRRVNIHPTEIV